jgi:hypothetical protein
MLVNIGWIFFRADTFEKALYFLTNMWTPSLWVFSDESLYNIGLVQQDMHLLVVSLIVLIAVDICNAKNIVVRDLITKQGLWLRWAIYIAAAVFVITCGIWGPGYDAASFIYSSF